MARTCARCGVDIAHRDPRSRHCSALCRDRDYEGAAVGTTRTCRFCATPFAPTKGTQVYCSATCRARNDVAQNRAAYNRRNAERRARERGARAGESFTREEVFDRDGWICQLCFTPMDWTLSGRGSEAPALDHVIPLSKGGSHTWGNVQASHMGCNGSKGDRDVILTAPPRLTHV